MRPLLIVLLLSAVAHAQDVEPVCKAEDSIDVDALLRRASLDLRGRIPTVEEYAQVEGLTDLPPELIRSFLADDGFRRTMRRHHEELLWSNVANVRLNIGSNLLRVTVNGTTSEAYNSNTTRRRTYRITDVPCDFTREQTEFSDAVNKVPVVAEVDGQRIEGFRWVTPYWAPDTQIKACAYDAQETETVTVGGQQVSCGDARAFSNRACGCGKDLKFCFANTSETQIRASLREQVLRTVDDVTVGERPYTDLLLGTEAWQDGKIAHWKKYLAQAVNYSLTVALPDPGEQVRDVSYADASWARVDRGELHAGVTTLPGFLLRFQTQRARANRFSNAFMCRPFEAPQDLVQEAGCAENGNDLTQRCYCQSCHRRLEPLSQHWALFTESGTTKLTDRTLFPEKQANCVGSSNSRCRRMYVTEPDAPEEVRGLLRAFEWSTLHPEYLPAVESGPSKQGDLIISTGEFADCTVRRMFQFFLKRPVDSAGLERELFQQLKADFIASGYALPQLIEQIVSLPEYRRVR